jgi:hypothetical protein
MPRQITRTRAEVEPTILADIPPVTGLDEFTPADPPWLPNEEELSRSERRQAEPEVTRAPQRGWGPVRDQRQKKSNFAQAFRIAEGDERLIHFLDPEPFDSYYRHWLRGIKGRQTFTCLRTLCPLCDIGDTPSYITLFNVVDLENRAEPTVKIWEASPNPAAVIEEYAFNPKHAPIDRPDLYFSISKRKQPNGFLAYSALPVKARDLPDDWDMQPLSVEELSELNDKKYDSEVIRTDTREALREVVKNLDDEG